MADEAAARSTSLSKFGRGVQSVSTAGPHDAIQMPQDQVSLGSR